MHPKIVKVSSQRQLRIPQEFYDRLHIGREVEVSMRSGEIVIRPVGRQDDFSEEILKDLMEQGYEGKELLEKFKEMKAKFRPAVKKMLDETMEETRKDTRDPDEVMREIFGDVMDERN